MEDDCLLNIRKTPFFQTLYCSILLLHYETLYICLDMDEFLDMAEVVRVCGLSRQEIWRRRRAGTFPEACKLGGERRVGFLRSEIDAWIKARRFERDARIEARKESLK